MWQSTPFDFRAAAAVAAPALASPIRSSGSAAGYDHCWVLDAGRDCDAELHSPHSGITLNLHSERRAIQFYGGQRSAGAHPGLSGVCLEPQDFPNAPNEPRFPSGHPAAGRDAVGFTYRSARVAPIHSAYRARANRH